MRARISSSDGGTYSNEIAVSRTTAPLLRGLCEVADGDGRGRVAERAPDIRDHVGDLLVGEIALPRRHRAVEGSAVDRDLPLQPVEDDVLDLLRIGCGHDRVLGERREDAGLPRCLRT